MGDVRVLVLRAAGINCDEEVMHAWQTAGARPALEHVNLVAGNPSMLDDFHIVTIPGGFSYGDDIAAGTILAQRILHDLVEPMRRLVERGGGILGICNGFQVLVKTGLLPGGDVAPVTSVAPVSNRCDADRGQVTVTFNDSAKFEARWVRLEVCTDHCVFLTPAGDVAPSLVGGAPVVPSSPAPRERRAPRGVTPPPRAAGFSPRDAAEHPGDTEHAAPAGTQDHLTAGGARPTFLEMPVEHAEGKVVTASEAVTRQLEEQGQIALRYVDADGRYDRYPANPNGSVSGIAGLCDPTGRILGLMPHPDRHFEHTHHPLWTRRCGTGFQPVWTAPPDGLTVFQKAVRYWQQL